MLTFWTDLVHILVYKNDSNTYMRPNKFVITTEPSGYQYLGSVLVKAPQDPPLKTVQEIGHPGTADFCTVLRGVGASQKCTKLPVREDPS